MKLLKDLKKLDIEHYNECLNFIKEGLSKHGFVTSLYQFGNIKFPGISDIDIMIIIDNLDNYTDKKKLIEEIISSAPNYDYCFHHGAIIISENESKYLGFFHSTENLNLLLGKEIINIEQNYKFGTNQILNWNIFFYTICFELLYKWKRISQRVFLLIINNLATSIKNNDMIFQTIYYKDFKNKVDKLRFKSINNLNQDYSIEAKKLLEEGLNIIKKQEYTTHKIWGIKIIKQPEKCFYISSNVPDIKVLGKFTFYLLPQRYFRARNDILNEAKTLFGNDFNINNFLETRDRFASYKILGLEKII